jgi:hypothetical protein
MNIPTNLSVAQRLFPVRSKFAAGFSRLNNMRRYPRLFCGLIVMLFPFAATFAQSSSSQQPAAQSQPQPQAKPAPPDQPPPKEDSLAEAARKAKEKKAATAKPKVYTEDDLSGMKGTGVSVVGETANTSAHAPKTTSPDGGGVENNEEYWRGKARQLLDAIADTDQQIAQKQDEIKKYGSGGIDVTTGLKDNIAYINDRTGQLKTLEKHKTDLLKQLDDLQEQGRKAGASPSWFR